MTYLLVFQNFGIATADWADSSLLLRSDSPALDV